MRNHSYFWTVTCCGAALLAFGSVIRPEPAQAQFGGIPGALLGGGLRFHFGGGGGGGGGSSRHHASKDKSDDDSSSSSSANNSRNDRVLASIGAPPSSVQTAVLKSVVSSGLLGVVGSTQDLSKLGQTFSKPGSTISSARKPVGSIRRCRCRYALSGRPPARRTIRPCTAARAAHSSLAATGTPVRAACL